MEAQNYMEENANSENSFLMLVYIGTPHFPHNTAPMGKLLFLPKGNNKLNERYVKKYQI